MSFRNWRPWDLVLVRERSTLVELATVWRADAHVAHSAATVALICPLLDDEMQRDWLQFDTGQAMMSMLLAAAPATRPLMPLTSPDRRPLAEVVHRERR